jgi:hypothetical protein
VVETWFQFETSLGDGNAANIADVQGKRPRKMKKKRALTSEEGVRSPPMSTSTRFPCMPLFSRWVCGSCCAVVAGWDWRVLCNPPPSAAAPSVGLRVVYRACWALALPRLSCGGCFLCARFVPDSRACFPLPPAAG